MSLLWAPPHLIRLLLAINHLQIISAALRLNRQILIRDHFILQGVPLQQIILAMIIRIRAVMKHRRRRGRRQRRIRAVIRRRRANVQPRSFEYPSFWWFRRQGWQVLATSGVCKRCERSFGRVALRQADARGRVKTRSAEAAAVLRLVEDVAVQLREERRAVVGRYAAREFLLLLATATDLQRPSHLEWWKREREIYEWR